MKLNLSQIYLTKTLTVLTAHRLIKRKSTWFLTLIGICPSIIFLFWILKMVFDFQTNDMPYAIYHIIMSIFHLTFFTPILAIFLGLGVISDEIETKNITFILVRPLNRTSIILGRFLGHYLVGLGCIIIGLTCTYLANMVFQLDAIFSQIPNFLNTIFVMGYGLLGYLAVVSVLGTFWKKFAILGCIIWFVFDTLISLLPIPNLNAISVKHHMLRGLWDPALQFLPTAAVPSDSAGWNALSCVFFAAVSAALMIWRLSAFELSLSSGDNN